MQSTVPTCSSSWYTSVGTILECLKIWDQTLAAVGSWLTLVLVVIYLSQNELLKEQAKAMKAAYTPALLINSVEFLDVDSEGNQTDLIKLKLTNIGNEVAKDIRIRCHVRPVKRTLEERTCSRFPISSATVRLKQNQRPVYDSESNGAVLSEHDCEVECSAEIKMRINQQDTANNPYPFRTAMIDEVTGRRVRFGFEILYENSAGYESSLPIEPGIEFNVPSDAKSFKEIYELAESGDDESEMNVDIFQVNRVIK